MTQALSIAVHLTGALLLAAACAAIVLPCGLWLWLRLARRPPEAAELLGPVFLLGLVPCTLLSASLIPVGGRAPALAAAALSLAAAAALALRRARVLHPSLAALRGSLARRPLWWIAVGLLALPELLVCAAPNTAWDAYTLHYAIVESFQRSRTLAPQGLNLGEYGHLNSELLNALWMALAGERAANTFAWLQVLSLGATLYLAIRRLAAAEWAFAGAAVAIGLPVSVHQSAGGWVDTLLVQAALAALVLYEAGSRETRPAAWGLMAGLCAGYAWGVKQSAPVLLLPLALLAFWDLCRAPGMRAKALLLAGGGIVLAGPWLLRTWSLTGNPLYPAFPMLTRLPVTPDFADAAGGREPLPGGFFRMLAAHGARDHLLDDAITPWLFVLLAAGLAAHALRVRGEGRLNRLWAAAAVSFAGAYVFFPANPRYALFAYLFALVPALGSLAAGFPGSRLARGGALGAAALSLAFGCALAGGKAWNRRAVLAGGMAPEQFRAATYPYLRLIPAARDRAAPGEAILVFDGLAYLAGLRSYSADPRAPATGVVDWSRASLETIRENLRRLGVRWLVVPFGYGRYRSGVALWAAREMGAGDPGEAGIREFAGRRFPEWQWDGGPLQAAAGEERFRAVAEAWARLRPLMEPVGSAPGVALYELRSDGPAGAPARVGRG